jgi:hypothetical protein
VKAITLTQPWATLMAIGAKRIETRGWSTQFRGPVAIHAAKGFPPDARHICWESPFREVLQPLGFIDYGRYDDLALDSMERFERLPRMAILAVGTMVAARSTKDINSYFAAGCGFDGVFPAEFEYDFGDYGARRYGFGFSDVRKLDMPIACRGSLGLWDVPGEIARQIA